MKRFFFLLVLAFNLLPGLYAIDKEELKPYMMPEDHPLQQILPLLFQGMDSSLFGSFASPESEGFIVLNEPINMKTWSIIVFTHSLIANFVIKKYPNASSEDVANYVTRIQNARRIHQYIVAKNFKHIVVPQKWLWKLPDSFDSSTGEPSFILVAERLNIVPGDSSGGVLREFYHNMDKAVAIELCTTLFDFGGCDAWPQNQPFTWDNRIAFIDTEQLGCTFDDFRTRSVNYINPKLYRYLMALWQNLERQRNSG